MSLSSERRGTFHRQSFEMHQRRYNMSLLGGSFTLIPCQTFFQEGPDLLRTLLLPLTSHRPFGTDVIETIVNMAVAKVGEIFQVDDAAASSSSSSESQPPEIPLWLVINATANRMHATTQNPFRMVPLSEEAIDTLLKKSTVVQSECCCCVCLDEFDVNADFIFHFSSLFSLCHRYNAFHQAKTHCPLCQSTTVPSLLSNDTDQSHGYLPPSSAMRVQNSRTSLLPHAAFLLSLSLSLQPAAPATHHHHAKLYNHVVLPLRCSGHSLREPSPVALVDWEACKVVTFNGDRRCQCMSWPAM
ncbi:hypothetical protein DEO72_LG3g1934 [Vigna unguiculata]|uniref:Uncharacterized protein n=1 Tax=Vigna unguiculata TaxID=3917 RepID=A0A4D6LFW4_VIGUN|nr:hypothetical protein DEO72_LG3g1934 [Vigna unguiculata]